MSNRHIVVTRYDDLDRAPDVSEKHKQRVATILDEQSWDCVVWIPGWLLEDDEKDIETVEASDHLAVGEVENYSEKAWRFKQSHRNTATSAPEEFLPKSSVVVFERGRGVESIQTPQAGLTEFSGGPA